MDVLTTTTGLTDALDTVTSENECAEGGHAKRSALSDRIELNGGPKKTKKKELQHEKRNEKGTRNGRRSHPSVFGGAVVFRAHQLPIRPIVGSSSCAYWPALSEWRRIDYNQAVAFICTTPSRRWLLRQSKGIARSEGGGHPSQRRLPRSAVMWPHNGRPITDRREKIQIIYIDEEK